MHIPTLRLFTLSLFFVYSSAAARAQAHPENGLDRTVTLGIDNSSMEAALKSVQLQAHVNIVADSTPVKKVASMMYEGTVRGALDRIAETFDYAWSQDRSGIVLMSKRFKTPDERPQIVLEEVHQMALDQVKALKGLRFDPNERNWGPMIRELAHTLSQEQLQALRGGTELTAKQLTPTQLEMVQQVILTRALAGPAGDCARLAVLLKTLQNSQVRAVEQPSAGSAGGGRRFTVEHVGGLVSDPIVTYLGDLQFKAKEGGK